MRSINKTNLVTKLLIFLIFVSFNTYICFYAKDKTEGIVNACIGTVLVILVATMGFFLVRSDQIMEGEEGEKDEKGKAKKKVFQRDND